jgi:hypothetical protein
VPPMVNLKLYEQVVLRRDIPADGLKAGDVATLVDLVPGRAEGSHGAVLEVFNALGQTLCVTSVSVDDVEPLQENEIFSVRRLARAG